MKSFASLAPIAAAAAVAALLSACGPAPRPVDRDALRSVPEPDLARLSEAVARQLRDQRAALDAALADRRTPPQDLAGQFGGMGRLYHAYGLVEAALDCYANAETLDGTAGEWPYLAAVLHQDRGETDEAAAAFSRALEDGLESPAVLLRLAEVRIGQGRNAEAEELYQRAVAAAPDSAAAHNGLGRTALARDEYEAAVRHFERALALQPEASSVHYLLAQAYRGLGDTATAERQLALMKPGDVTFPDPYVDAVKSLVAGVGGFAERAITALGEGRPLDAAAEYRRALEEDPENLTAMRGLGLALRTAGDFDGAVAAYRNMVERYPKHPLARLELATVLMEQGSLDEAIAEFRRALEIDPEFKQAHFNLGAALARAGRFEEAAQSFEKVLAIDGHDANARYQLAVVMDELGRREEAIALLRQAAAEDPENVKARQRLGHHLAELGDLDGAVREYQAVLAIAGAPAQEKALAHYQLGRIAKQRGEDRPALEHFETAVELFPDLWVAHVGLGNALRDLGRYGDAEKAYRRVVDADPKNVLARLGEAESLILDGHFGDARQRLEEGLAALPRSAELGHLLARLLATAPSAELRDGDRSFELANQIFQAYPSIEHAETVVMAMAEQGRFDEAVAFQEKLIARAEREGHTAELGRMRENLARYRRREPARSS